MKTPDDYSISLAYSYSNNKELAMYYNDSAKDYDAFVDSVGYVLPKLVAKKAIEYIRPSDKILDIGCGTGILGIELNSLKEGLSIHGIDISSSMIIYAFEKRKESGERHYEKFFHADISTESDLLDGGYSFMVSSGTFTTGHLDASHLSQIFGLMEFGSYAVFSVKGDHFEQSGFLEKLKDLDSIEIIDISEVDSYENAEYSAMSKIVSLRLTKS